MLECIEIIAILIVFDKLLGLYTSNNIDEETLEELKIIK